MNQEEEAERNDEMGFGDKTSSGYHDTDPDKKKIDDHEYETNEYEEETKAKQGDEGTSQEGKGKDKRRKRKRGRKNGPNPKKPYLLFLNSVREEIKQDHPGISYAEFGVMVEEMWMKANKREWREKALLDQQQNENEMKDENEMKEYHNAKGEKSIRKKAKEMFEQLEDKSEWEEKALLDYTEKNKSRPAYLQFWNAKREEITKQYPNIPHFEIKRKATKMFSELEDKSEWEEKALLDYAEKNKHRPAYLQFFNAKREEIKEQNPGIDDYEIKKKVTEMFKELEDNNAKGEKDKDEPRTGISNAYLFFLNAKREEIKEQNPGIDDFEIKKKATEMFQELEDKSEWEEKALLDYAEKNKHRPAYLQFLNAKREEIKKQNPGIKDLEIKRKAGEMFRALEDISEWEEKGKKKQEKEKDGHKREKNRRRRRNQLENKKAKKMMYEMQSTEKEQFGQ